MLSFSPMPSKNASPQVELVKRKRLHHRFHIPFAVLLAPGYLPFFPVCQMVPATHHNQCLVVWNLADYDLLILVPVYVIFEDLEPVMPVPRHLPLPRLRNHQTVILFLISIPIVNILCCTVSCLITNRWYENAPLPFYLS
ncbi:unnamed protein product [Protopolystoma xenopodis]|uniref:Uncharacterized protein n=1 Tax=Protopolystoma xenopodis TaxID=117903 RepID=A0A448WZ99_9PLAT|nr:unnamed protein product [Protopolystoma xenopodis]